MKTLTNDELVRAQLALARLASQPMPLWLLYDFTVLLDKLTEPLNKYYDDRARYLEAGADIKILDEKEAVRVDEPIILPLECDIHMSHTDLQALKGLIELPERRAE